MVSLTLGAMPVNDGSEHNLKTSEIKFFLTLCTEYVFAYIFNFLLVIELHNQGYVFTNASPFQKRGSTLLSPQMSLYVLFSETV